MDLSCCYWKKNTPLLNYLAYCGVIDLNEKIILITIITLTIVLLVLRMMAMLVRCSVILMRWPLLRLMLIVIWLTARAVSLLSFSCSAALSMIMLSSWATWLATLILLLMLEYTLIIRVSIVFWKLWFLNVFLIIFSFGIIIIFIRTIIVLVNSLFLLSMTILAWPWVSLLARRRMCWNLITVLELIVHSLVNYISTMKADESVIMPIYCESSDC